MFLGWHRALKSPESQGEKKETVQYVVRRYNLLWHPHQVPSGVLVNEYLEKFVHVVNLQRSGANLFHS
jgi:hypothetical protein